MRAPRQLLLARLEEVSTPAVAKGGGDVFPAEQTGDALKASQCLTSADGMHLALHAIWTIRVQLFVYAAHRIGTREPAVVLGEVGAR